LDECVQKAACFGGLRARLHQDAEAARWRRWLLRARQAATSLQHRQEA
jgi:hypothetical protein